jgi:hypothetical protein
MIEAKRKKKMPRHFEVERTRHEVAVEEQHV